MKKIAMLCVACVLGGAAGAVEEVTPAHVYQAVGQVAADVALIRGVMGKPALEAPPWIVDHAEPRHVLYQAQALHRKASRLARQLGVEALPLPAVPHEEIVPGDVIQFVRGAHEQLDLVRAELGLAYSADLPPFVAEQHPRDVLREVVQASRQLNLMLEEPIRPADVYDLLELAATYVAGALTHDEAAPVYGALPPFEGGKVPGDVYRRVLECLGQAQVIGASQGIEVLQLNLRRELRRRDIAPADVYHLATTLLSELAHLTLRLDAKNVGMPPVERPKHIFPSHVFRIAGMLQNELAALEQKLVSEG